MTWRRSFDASWPMVAEGIDLDVWVAAARRGRNRLAAPGGLGSESDAAAPGQRPATGCRAIRRCAPSSSARALATVADSRPREGFYVRELRTFIDDPLMSMTFEEQHAVGRRIGVRFLHPYWDPDLVEHLYRTPPEILTRGLRTKGHGAAAVARRFPGLGLRAQKESVGALVLCADAGKGCAGGHAALHRFFRARRSRCRRSGGRARVRRERGSAVRRATRSDAWRLVVLESWVRSRSV